MATAGKIGSEYPELISAKTTDKVVVFSNGSTYSMKFSTLLTNSNCNWTLGNTQVLSVYNIIITNNTTPSSSNTATTKGAIWSDGDYIYVGTANNEVKRIPSPLTLF